MFQPLRTILLTAIKTIGTLIQPIRTILLTAVKTIGTLIKPLHWTEILTLSAHFFKNLYCISFLVLLILNLMLLFMSADFYPMLMFTNYVEGSMLESVQSVNSYSPSVLYTVPTDDSISEAIPEASSMHEGDTPAVGAQENPEKAMLKIKKHSPLLLNLLMEDDEWEKTHPKMNLLERLKELEESVNWNKKPLNEASWILYKEMSNFAFKPDQVSGKLSCPGFNTLTLQNIDSIINYLEPKLSASNWENDHLFLECLMVIKSALE